MRIRTFAFGWALEVTGRKDQEAVEAKLLKAFPAEMASATTPTSERLLPGLGSLQLRSQSHKSKPKQSRPGQ